LNAGVRQETRFAVVGFQLRRLFFFCTVAPSVVHHQLSSRFHLIARSRCCSSSLLAAVFFLAIFICSQSGEQPWEYLAKSGYKPEINDKSLIILLCVLATDIFFSNFRCCVLG
jgi:hypothetical protein